MCTRERYRIENLTYAKQDGSKRIWITDRADGYSPPFWRVEKIPCGLCTECRLQYAKEWATRCMKEAKYHKDNIMITLTYEDEHLPKSQGIDPTTGEVFESSTLVKKDVQDFMKRVIDYWARHYDHKYEEHEVAPGEDYDRYSKKDDKYYKVDNPGIRRFYCGEYGSDKEYINCHGIMRQATERPHYHVILFNMPVPDMVFDRWAYCEWNPKIKNALYKSKVLTKLWGMGHVDLNEVNYNTCCYVARYVTKKQKGKEASNEHYTLKGRIPPYVDMSRRPGIGYQYFKDNQEKFFEEKPIWLPTKTGLKKVKSRYFDKQMEKIDPERFDEIKRSRKKKSEKMWDNILSKTDIDMHEYIENSESKSEIKNRFLKIRK